MKSRQIRSLPNDTPSNGLSGVYVLLGILLVLSLVTAIATIYTVVKIDKLGPGSAAPSVPTPSGGAPTAPPAKVDVSVDDDAVLGDKDAPVTIIEFSDYQCPFCQRFHQNTWPQLKSTYIDTGKVKFVHRDFPLGFHQNAEIAAQASTCAGDQKKYWEMHEILFAKGQGDGTGLDVASLKQYAADLKLNTGTFNSCLDSGKYKAEVQKDMADGAAAGVQGTPSFFINGQILVGAQPFSAFQQVIEAELAK